MKLLSIVIPCYNEDENVSLIYGEIIKLENFLQDKSLDVEILYIDDGSSDNTAQEVRKLHFADNRVKLVSFSRNFGKESAIYAGLEKSNGDYVVMMDADLQDPPTLLPKLYTYIEEGYDSAATRRVSRKGEPIIRSFFARRFYTIMNKVSKTDIVDGARDYRLMTRQVVDSILAMKEYNRFSKGIFGWVGYKTKWVEFENVERIRGETKWSFWKLFLYSLDGIVAFSTAPLGIASVLGVVFCMLSFLLIIAIIIRTLKWGDPVAGWPSMICIISMIGGVQLLCMGIIGQYVSKTYMEVKGRPKYLVSEEIK